jgi:hypothetical protein
VAGLKTFQVFDTTLFAVRWTRWALRIGKKAVPSMEPSGLNRVSRNRLFEG